MADEYTAPLVDLQRRSTAAWDAVEAYRKLVDSQRRAEPRVDTTRGPALRPWTPAEDAGYDQLHTAAVQAAEALRAGIDAAGLDGGYDVTQGLHKAARE